MNVRVAEVGQRPFGLTSARKYAPAGAAIIGEVLGAAEFADYAEVVLDWTNELRLQPDEVAKPVLMIATVRRFPDLSPPDNVLTITVRLDVDDLFGNDEITAAAIHDIVREMEEYSNEATQRRLSA